MANIDRYTVVCAILLKVILRDKLSGWGYVIIPDISVCIVCPLGLLIFYKYYFACL